jgi:hypothetical protein
MVHEYGERTVAVVEGAEAVWNTDHPVRAAFRARHGVSGCEYRLEDDARV